MIDRIVTHKVNKSARHRFAKKGDALYKISWYGYGEGDDTWEPIQHLPRSKVLSYVKKKKMSVPNNIDQAIDG